MVEPTYPKKFYKMTHIANTSYLYLPCVRLIEHGILDLDADLHPDATASVFTAIVSIDKLKQRGYLD
jgi:hypothetical protein